MPPTLRSSERTMKAIRVHEYNAPEKLRYEDAPTSHAGTGQVLVRVHAASVNPIDYKLASGDLREYIPLSFPWVPGVDFSGTIEAIGPGTANLRPGDAVYGASESGGAYAEFVAAAVTTIAPKPAKLSHLEAASVPAVAQTAWQGLIEYGRLEPGKTVLIHGGARAVGTYAVQLAHWKGGRVVVTGSAENMEYLSSLGAAQIIDYLTSALESVVRDADLVLDLVAGETQMRSFKVLRPGGCLVTTTPMVSEDAANHPEVRATSMRYRPSTKLLEQLTELINAGTIRTVVMKTFSLAQAQDAWRYAQRGHARGKIVLRVST